MPCSVSHSDGQSLGWMDGSLALLCYAPLPRNQIDLAPKGVGVGGNSDDQGRRDGEFRLGEVGIDARWLGCLLMAC